MLGDARQHYLQVARLHAEGIHRGFLATLGEKFLALLYRCIDDTPEAVLITEVKNGDVIGFVAGANTLTPIYRRMLMRLPSLLVALAPVLSRPTKLLQIMELVRHNCSSSQTDARGQPLPKFELLSIAVAPSERRSGVAQRLYSRLKIYSANRDIDEFKIIVGEELEDAHRFYRRMGASVVSELNVHGKRKSLVYVQSTGPQL